MKKYLMCITCDINDGDYIRDYFIVSEEDVPSITEMIKTVKRLRESYTKHFSPSWTAHDNLAYYGEVRDTVFYKNNNFKTSNSDIEAWEVSESDIENFIDFDRMLPVLDNEEVHTVDEIELYELANTQPIKLYND